MLAVVAIHVSSNYVNYPAFFQSTSWWIANSLDSLCRPAVPLFIMLSGAFLLAKPIVSYPEFLKRRLTRVGIPLVFWTIFYFVWQRFFWGHAYSVYDMFSLIFNPYVYYHLYFLYIIIGLYMITPLLQTYIQNSSEKTVKMTIIGLFIFSASIYLVNFIFPQAATTFDGLTMFIPYIPYFMVGYYLWNKKITKGEWFIYGIIFLLFTAITALGNDWSMRFVGWSTQAATDTNYKRYFYEYLSINVIGMSLFGFILLRNIGQLLQFAYKSWVLSLIVVMAPCMFGVYLLHPAIMDLAGKFFPAFALRNVAVQTAWLWMFGEITLVFVVSFAVVWLCRKIPYAKIIFG